MYQTGEGQPLRAVYLFPGRASRTLGRERSRSVAWVWHPPSTEGVMTNDISSSSETPAPALTPGSAPRAARWRRLGLPWLLLAALVVVAAIVVPVVVVSASHRAGPAGGDSGPSSSPQASLYREQVT